MESDVSMKCKNPECFKKSKLKFSDYFGNRFCNIKHYREAYVRKLNETPILNTNLRK